MKTLGYLFISLSIIGYLGLLVFGLIQALPFGLIGLSFLLGLAILLVKILKDKRGDHEDEYYTKNIDK